MFVETVYGIFVRSELIILQQKIVHARGLIKELDVEGVQITELIEVMADDVDMFREEMVKIEKAQQQTQESVADEVARKAREADDELQRKAEEDKEAIRVEKERQLGLISLASQVRHKAADGRTTEERRWIALDMLLHPELYVACSVEDAEVYRLDEAYSTVLSKAEARRIASLPSELQLAAAYLRNDEEVKAHRLIQHFEFGNGDKVLRQREDESLDKIVGGIDEIKALVIRDENPSLDSSAMKREWRKYDKLLRPHMYISERSKPRFDKVNGLSGSDLERILYSKKEELRNDEEIHIKRLLERNQPAVSPPRRSWMATSLDMVPDAISRGLNVMVDREKTLRLLSVEEQPLEARGRASHCFEIPQYMQIGRLKVTAVYKGTFAARGFVLGRLGMALYRQSDPPQMVGFSGKDDVCLNSEETLGRTVIIHSPGALPICTGRYEVAIAAPSKTLYSLSVTCDLVDNVQEAVGRAVLGAYEKSTRLRVCE